MFPSSATLDNFSLGRTKFTYLLVHGLAPYFREMLLDDMKDQYFSLGYDETTNEASSKELRMAVRYWSLKREKIVSSHLRTLFIGRATAQVLSEKLVEGINESSLSLSKMLMLSRDGPAVNQLTQSLINEKVKKCRTKPLMDIGTYNIHIAHNAFSYGLEQFGEESSEIIVLLYNFFHGWPSRIEDFQAIQKELGLPDHSFIKHSPLRWLTLEAACDRLIEQFPAAKKYFADFVPKERKSLTNRVSYVKILRYLKNSTSLAELHFVKNSAQIFSTFTRAFQKDAPLIHVLHEELRTVALKFMNRVCQSRALRDLGVCLKALEPQYLLPASDVVIGEDATKELELAKVSEKDRLIFSKRAQEHMVASLRHLLKKSALRQGSAVRYFRCLQPKERCSTRSVQDIMTVARSLPADVDVDTLRDEWILLQQEKDDPNIDASKTSIDVYWAQFFRIKRSVDGKQKYPNVATIVQAALAVSHGQADLERGFSGSGRTLTADRASMSEKTLDAYMVVKSVLLQYGNDPQLVPITSALIASAEGAHAAHQDYVEKEQEKQRALLKAAQEKDEEKRKEAEEKKMIEGKREELSKAESKLKEQQADESLKRKTGMVLLEEGNKRLKIAIENKNFEEVALAQAMIEAAQRKQDDALKREEEVKNLQSKIEKEKDKLIKNCLAKSKN